MIRVNKFDDTVYSHNFSHFLEENDEKEILFKYLKSKRILKKNTEFLDIGAGTGGLTRKISKLYAKSTIALEPNKIFAKELTKDENNKVLNKKWEDYFPSKKFDFILCAYSSTHFKREEFGKNLDKIIDSLKTGGTVCFAAVHETKGTWRKIHQIYYRLKGLNTTPSTKLLREYFKSSKHEYYEFWTRVSRKSPKELSKKLSFDFDVPDKLPREIVDYVSHCKNSRNGLYELTICHVVIIYKKSKLYENE